MSQDMIFKKSLSTEDHLRSRQYQRLCLSSMIKLPSLEYSNSGGKKEKMDDKLFNLMKFIITPTGPALVFGVC